MVVQEKSKVCFGTLALGANYRNLARELAQDLEKYSPQTPLVILTDQPKYFSSYPNVLAFKHRQQSIGCYHDKRFVINQALKFFESCIFIDADLRILDFLPENMEWQPGITGHTIWTNILKHNKNPFEIQLLERIAKKLELNLEEVSFVREALFVVTKDSGKETDFLKCWDQIAPFLELQGFVRGEGHSIGLAAAKAGLKIIKDPMNDIKFFDDKLELDKIKKTGSLSEGDTAYWQIQRTLKYPSQTIFKKIRKKIFKVFRYSVCYLNNLKMFLKDLNFYLN